MVDPKLAEEVANKALRRVVVAEGKAADEQAAETWLANLPPQELLAFMKGAAAEKWAAAMDGSALRMRNFPHLMRDGTVLPKEGFAAFAGSAYNPIPLIVGAADREFITFAAADPVFAKQFRGATLAADPKLRDAFIKVCEYASRVYSGFNLDTVLDKVLANAKQPPCYAYRLGWGLEHGTLPEPYNRMLAASHTNDSDFMSGYENYFIKGLYPDIFYTAGNKPGRDDLSRHFMAYFKNFLRTGNPNGKGLVDWKSWTKGNEQVLYFTADNDKAVIGMKAQYLPREKTLAALQELSPEDRKLVEELMAGRFFFDVDY